MRTVIAAALLTLTACHSTEPAPEAPVAPAETDAAAAPAPAAEVAPAPEAAVAPTGLVDGTVGTTGAAGTVDVTVVGGGLTGATTATGSASTGH